MFRFFLEPQKDRFSDKFIHISLASEPQARALIELMVAERFSYHPNYFSTMLHKEYGVTFSDLVNAYRTARGHDREEPP